MPRRDGNTPATSRRSHKSMHSGRKGSGLDRKLKAQKKALGDPREVCPICRRPVSGRAHYRGHDK
jgi:hypothetical protein